MTIVHLNLIDKGGAWIAANRISDSISQSSLSKVVSMSSSEKSFLSKVGPRVDMALEKKSNSDMTVSFFRSVLRSREYKHLDHFGIQDASILNLHWMPGKITSDFNKLLKGKKIFWTLHDMNPITAYCHHAFSCQGSQNTCSRCPQGPSYMQKAIEITHNQKARVAIERNIRFIAPSKWILSLAEKSSISRNCEIFHIPNPVPVEKFQKLHPSQSHSKTGAASKINLGVLGANYNGNKGAQYSRDILKALVSIFPNRVIPCFIGDVDPMFINLEYKQLARNSSENETASFLGELDLLIYTSKADTFPNLLLEAQSCGVPIVAWDVGGVAETFNDHESGYLVGSTFKEAIQASEAIITDDCKRQEFSEKARANVIEKFSYPVIAKQYLHAYSSELGKG
jgi:glycosyltransferase involved in cell wall biosynthesis